MGIYLVLLLQSIPEIRNYEDIGLKSFLIFIILVCFFVVRYIYISKEKRINEVIDEHKNDLKQFDNERNKTITELTSTLHKIALNIEQNRINNTDLKENLTRLIAYVEQVKQKLNE